jgi:drug/metabolite transporter (DMT)-like permease
MNPWTPLILAIAGWGLSNVLSKAILNTGLDSFTYLPIRYAVGLGSLLLFLALTRKLVRPGGDAWTKGAILGLVNMAIPTMFMTRGLEYIPATVGSLLIALIPISTVLAAHFVVPGEPFRPKTLPGLLLSLVGVGFLIGGGSNVVQSFSELMLGVGLTIIGVVIAGMGGAISRRFTLETPASRLVVPQFLFGLISLVIGFAIFGETGSGPAGAETWVLILAAGTVGTAVPFGAFLFAAEVNPASRLALSGYIVPVVAAIGAVLFLGESFTLLMFVGAALILAGVYMSEKSGRFVPAPGDRTTA